MAVLTERPGAGEYAPYYERYVGRVPEGDVVELLAQQAGEAAAFLRAVPASRADHRYEPGKWSVKEVVGHVSDAERIFAYRLLRIARGDQTPLPGFDENEYAAVAGPGFSARTLESLVSEWEDVRRATLSLLHSLDREALARTGTASNFTVSARALAHILYGHMDHHLAILRERYLGGA
ncbi:MAG TPA: DinB family protein [Longimicrobium sp.]|nr:DinB family protein [Longimicrobium sp.]